MKKFILFALVLMALSACAPVATSAAVQLPEGLVVLINFGAMVAVTAAFKWLSARLGGVDLSGQAAVIASAVASLVVLAVNYGLQLVPAMFDNWLSAIFSFLIVLLGGAGFYNLFLRKKQPEEKSKAKVKAKG